MNWKPLLASPTHTGTRTMDWPLTVWAYRGRNMRVGGRGVVGVLEEAGNILVSEHLTGWLAETIWGFLKRHGLSCTPAPYEGTAGSAIVTGLHVSPTRATAAVAMAVGGGGGGWHTWTVCPRGMHHIQHSLSPLLPPQYSTSPPLEWVSSGCWQQWQAQHRETMGGG